MANDADVGLTFSKNMKILLDMDWLNGKTLGYIGAGVLGETVGPGSIANQHFQKGQSKWAPLAKSTLESPRKKDKRKFYHTGAVYKALTTNVDQGKAGSWGKASDVGAKGKFRSKKYRSGGIFAQVTPFQDGVTVVVGFNGRLRHSAAFNKLRKTLAIEKGLNIEGMKSRDITKAVNKLISVEDTQKALGTYRDKKGKKIKKYSIARSRRKGVTNNLAYANIVQAGPFNKKKKTIRPLMPFESGDSVALAKVIEDRAARILKKIEKG